MYDEVEVEVEDVEVQEGDEKFSYDAKVVIMGRYEPCECSSEYHGSQVTQSWVEKDIDDVMLVSYKKYKVNQDDFDTEVEGDMPKEAWQKIQSKAMDVVEFDEYE